MWQKGLSTLNQFSQKESGEIYIYILTRGTIFVCISVGLGYYHTVVKIICKIYNTFPILKTSLDNRIFLTYFLFLKKKKQTPITLHQPLTDFTVKRERRDILKTRGNQNPIQPVAKVFLSISYL